MTNEELLARATQFSFEASPSVFVSVDRVGELGDPWADRWAIRYFHECLTKSGRWVTEPSPSNRTDSFKNRTRFTLEEAMERASKAANTLQLRHPR
jgi:hypothetical protein